MNLDIEEYKVLVAGAGSIGRRHLGNLGSLGIRNLAACDPDQQRLARIVEELNVSAWPGYEKALEEYRPDLVLICTPPVLHVEQARMALEAGCHVFIEKPLAPSLEGVNSLIERARKSDRVVQVGYNLRYHPGIKTIKRFVEEGKIGKVLWASFEFGQYLPDWRPWQDYRISYTARKEMGGGIILDASHELDYALWLLGTPSRLVCMAGKSSGLEMDVEDNATLLIRFESDAEAVVHVDCIQRAYSRKCKLVSETGTILWDYNQNQVNFFHSAEEKWENLSYEFDPNDMYLREIETFLERTAAGGSNTGDLESAKLVLKVTLAALQSAAKKEWVSLKQPAA